MSLRALLSKFLVANAVAISALAANAVYIGQSSSGSGNGSSCANQEPYTYFNSPANWSGSPTGVLIGPDTTVHLCGTITGTGGTNASVFTFQGSGTSGHPITLVWETSAALTASYFGLAIDLSTRQYIVLDGGVPCGTGQGGSVSGIPSCNGIIQNTANGTNLANQAHSTFIASSGDCTGCEFRNLGLYNNYVHIQCELGPGMCDTNAGTTENAVITLNGGGSSVSIHDNTIHDCSWCVNFQAATGNTGYTFQHNNLFAVAHGAALYGGITWAGPAIIHDNNFGDMSNWDTGSDDKYHADGIHAFGMNLSEIDIYNNQFNTQNQCCITGAVFLEGGVTWTSGGTWRVFNNIAQITGGSCSVNGLMQTYVGNLGQFFNNTVTGCSASNNSGFVPTSASGFAQNNAITGFGILILFGSPPFFNPPTVTDVNNNAYGNCTSFNCWEAFGQDTGSFTTYIAGCGGCEPASSYTANLNLNANGTPTSSSTTVIGRGKNLTSLCSGVLTALCFDIFGTARPSSGAWDVGAAQFATGASTASAGKGSVATAGGGVVQ